MLYLPMQMIDWSEIRKQFPVTENSVYLNTAAAGPLPRATSDAASDYYRLMMNDGDIHWDEWLAQREEVQTQSRGFHQRRTGRSCAYDKHFERDERDH